MKKTKKSITESHINVKVIMRSIEEKAKKYRLKEDIALLESLDIRKLKVSNADVESVKKNISHLDDESLDHNLHFLNTHYSLIDKYNPFSSHRKGIFRKIANAFLQKHFDKTKMFLNSIFSAQEMFNVRVVRIFNAIVKTIFSLEEKIADSSEHMEDEISRLHTTFDEYSSKIKDREGKLDQTLAQFQSQTEKIDEMLSMHRKDLSQEFQTLTEQGKQALEQKFTERLTEQSERLTNQLEASKKSILYPSLDLDYKKFEDRFRGSQEVILQKQKQYLRFFHECKNVMDIGCGRGEFIELLHQNGAGAFGIEIDPEMVKECHKKNLNIISFDVVSYLKLQLAKEKPDNIDGIFSAQVVEHLHMDYIIEMLRLCYQILQPNHFIVLETINVRCLTTFTSSIYLDPTHVKPIHPETLKFILESLGFREIAFIFSSDFPDEVKLRPIKVHSPEDAIYNENIQKLNELLFAPQDYAIIAKK